MGRGAVGWVVVPSLFLEVGMTEWFRFRVEVTVVATKTSVGVILHCCFVGQSVELFRSVENTSCMLAGVLGRIFCRRVYFPSLVSGFDLLVLVAFCFSLILRFLFLFQDERRYKALLIL